MPLVVPGLQSKSGSQPSGGEDQLSKWTNSLMGKKIGDQSNETTFAKSDLPTEHRILKPDSLSTADFKENRLNVHVGEDGTVRSVKFG